MTEEGVEERCERCVFSCLVCISHAPSDFFKPVSPMFGLSPPSMLVEGRKSATGKGGIYGRRGWDGEWRHTASKLLRSFAYSVRTSASSGERRGSWWGSSSSSVCGSAVEFTAAAALGSWVGVGRGVLVMGVVLVGIVLKAR